MARAPIDDMREEQFLVGPTRVGGDHPVGDLYRRNPYAAVAIAVGIGYLAGGGLFTPFTRRIAKMGMKALFIPVAAEQLKSLTRPVSQNL